MQSRFQRFKKEKRREVGLVYYDFDKVIDRKNTQSSKWDNVEVRVGKIGRAS